MLLKIAVLMAVAIPVFAHHSFAAEFDQTRVLQMVGTVTEMEWVNPHAVIHLDVRNADGSVTHWLIEGNTPNSLLRAGFTKKSLKAGTPIAVQGYRSKSGDNIASASAILLRDGRKFGDGVLSWVSADEKLWQIQLEAASHAH